MNDRNKEQNNEQSRLQYVLRCTSHVLRFADAGAGFSVDPEGTPFSVLGSRFSALALALMLASGCADQAAAPILMPSPTIAAPARQSPTPGAPATAQPTRAAAPTATPAAAAQRTTTRPEPTATPPQPEPFAYLWPAYLPTEMRVAPTESRVAREGEIGQNGLGFFIVTFASSANRLVIGGGATDTLPLTGEQRRVSVAGRAAMLTTGAAGRQVVFDVPTGVLFVYGSALSEEELLRVAGSLQPIDLPELRRRVGAE